MTEGSNPLRVLVVDDEPAIRRFLRAGLGSQGYIVSELEEGLPAIDIVRRKGTDLLVQDGSIYPAALSAESSSSLPAQTFMNQPDFYTLAKQFSASTAAATWGPDVNVAYSDFSDDFAATVKTQAGYLSALDKLQASVVSDMK